MDSGAGYLSGGKQSDDIRLSPAVCPYATYHIVGSRRHGYLAPGNIQTAVKTEAIDMRETRGNGVGR